MKAVSPEDLLGPLNAVERKHAPKTLYLEGLEETLWSGARVAIVGSRQASALGLARARRLAATLVERGVVVVSGLAAGIDTAAHTTAITRAGRTVAVLGTPLDRVYPPQNAALQRQIGAEHLLVSQFPSGAAIRRSNFPLRNRTMALISDATVIVEAGQTSGSISQGWEALRLGRVLYITQAVARDAALSWPRELLDYGARVLSDETLEDFLDMLPPRVTQAQDAALPF